MEKATIEVAEHTQAKNSSTLAGAKITHIPIRDSNQRAPTNLTIALEFDSPTTNMKTLVLALGRYEGCGGSFHTNCCQAESFNACSSFSESILVVSEAAPAAMVAASLGALGLLYAIKRRNE